VGADTVVTCRNKILGKPNSVEDAKVTLRNLRGQHHSVFTGVSIVLPLKDSSIIKTKNNKPLFNLEKILLKTGKNQDHHNKKRKIEENVLTAKVERLPFNKSYVDNATLVTLQSVENNTDSNDIIIISFVEETQVVFSSEKESFSDEVIDAYVATGEPM